MTHYLHHPPVTYKPPGLTMHFNNINNTELFRWHKYLYETSFRKHLINFSGGSPEKVIRCFRNVVFNSSIFDSGKSPCECCWYYSRKKYCQKSTYVTIRSSSTYCISYGYYKSRLLPYTALTEGMLPGHYLFWQLASLRHSDTCVTAGSVVFAAQLQLPWVGVQPFREKQPKTMPLRHLWYTGHGEQHSNIKNIWSVTQTSL